MTAKNAYRFIKKFRKNYPDENSSEYNLICDNLYLIKQRISGIGHTGNRELKDHIRKYLTRVGYVFSAESFAEYCRARKKELKCSEVYALGDVLCTLLVSEVAEECSLFLKNGRGSTVKMRSAIESLRHLPDLELEDIFMRLCPAEKLLGSFDGFSKGDEVTKNVYREALIKYARRHHTDEYTALENAGAKCKNNKLLAVLSPFSPTSAVLYYSLSFVISSAVIALSVYLWGILALIASLPITEGVFCLNDFIFSRIVKARPILRISPEYIPEGTHTLVVITSLLFGGKKDDELFSHLEEFYLRNSMTGIRFGVLGDFADSKKEHCKSDDAIMENAVSKINELNAEYGDIFSVFIRKRRENKADGIFGGRERKRGAVTELISAINGGAKPDICVCPFELENISYLLTLDGDTELPIDGASDLLCTALHPENLPEIKNGRVVGGHGIFQPSMRTRLADSTKTYHSLFGSRASGVYERASYDRYQTLLGSGVFCGKGLIDVRLFDRLVKPSVPDGIILSHDVIEGGILRCMLVSDTVFSDGTPKNSLSYFRRQHRWVRGDIQNAVFIGSKSSNTSLDFRLTENIRRLLTPVFAWLGIILSAFFSNGQNALPLFFLFTVNLWLPALFGIIATAVSRSYTPRRFFSRCVGAITQTAEGLIYSLCALAENAAVTTDAVIRSVWRMAVSKKLLLGWTTFSETNSGKGTLTSYVESHASCVLVGTVMVAFSPLVVYKICGLLWFLFPVAAYLTALPVKEKRHNVTDSERREVTQYAREIFSFFSENVTRKTHWLPPDNIQLSPAQCIAYRTSPTNIGFYIISLIAARDFGFIDSDSLYERADAVITTVESMEKSHGHLYNWYDIKSLRPIGGKYISAVDSGNFITMLVCAASGFDGYASENGALAILAERCRAIVKSADFSIFYNRKKHLLYLGCNESGIPDGNICYDMLMSEIRTTCYWLCATGQVPKKLWQSLSRTITAENGYIGMVSWAGSCFEYFMPELFLHRERDSFIDESMRFAVSMQKKRRKNGVFGISESGYFAFDPDMNYRYKAHGVPQLALKRYPVGQFIVSPYSSFLMLCDDPTACLKNLSLLEEMGCHGKYGFYEALDLTEGENVVQSYMSHHLGMSLTACADFCFDGIFVKRFMKDKRLFACRELLSESIPKDAPLYIGESDRHTESSRRFTSSKEVTDDNVSLSDPKASFVTGGGLTLISSSSGHIAMKCGAFAVNDCEFDIYRGDRTACFTFFEDGKPNAFTPLDGNILFSYEYSGSHFAFTSSSPRFPASVIGTIYKGCRTFAFKTRCSGDKVCRVGFSFVPIIAKQNEYSAHPSFSSLFVESYYDANERILFFNRRGGSFPVCAIALSDISLKPEFASNHDHLNAHSVAAMSDVFPISEASNLSGACISPLCAILTPELRGGNAVFLVTCGESIKECACQISKARKKQFPRQYHISPSRSATELLTACLFQKPSMGLQSLDSSCLWRFSLSASFPLAVLKIYEETSEVKKLLSAYLQLKKAFITTELLFITFEREKYSAPLRTFVEEETSGEYAPFMYRSGGIAIADAGNIGKAEFEFLNKFAAFYGESNDTEPVKRNVPLFIPPSILSEKKRGGETSFSTSGAVTDCKTEHFAPYSYVMSGHACGTVVTHKTLGFVFWRNARECKITPFCGDPYSDCYGLRLIATVGSRHYDLAASAERVVYENGVAVYHGSVSSRNYTLTVYARAKLAAVDYVLTFDNGGDVICTIIKKQPADMTAELRDGVWLFAPLRHSAVPFVGFMRCSEKSEPINDSALLFGGTDGGANDIIALRCKASYMKFSLGGAPSAESASSVASLCGRDDKSDEARGFAGQFLPEYLLKTGNNGLDSLFSCFSPYQTAISRFIGKTGFYQNGGAFGFRDQLQDCFCLIYSSPKTVKTHILRSCAHQYREGDVMHWWFKAPQGDTGIRTKCSDDFLFLPWAVANYIEKTGDTDILGIEVGYVESPPLPQGVGERYETPQISSEKESVYMHCIRALANGERTGSHGLSLMGSCDWNDGLSRVGILGNGESVFTSCLYVLVCREFIPVMKHMDDRMSISHFASVSAELLFSIERNAFDGDRYIRAYDDNGRAIGEKNCTECKTDILSQAFAAMVLGKTERTVKAMNTAVENLFDRQSKTFRLFDPPFDKYDAGYISSYCKGLRENGGQYTHGALWGVLGLICCGETAKALEILGAIMPYSHTDEKLFRVEPYVITADIYGGGKSGRGGWSWYTGSASWFFVIMLENILGIRLSHGFSVIDVVPLTDYSIDLKLPRGRLTICVSSLFAATSLDGEAVRFPFEIPDGDHRLEVRRCSNMPDTSDDDKSPTHEHVFSKA